jgi:hypothetical protein
VLIMARFYTATGEQALSREQATHMLAEGHCVLVTSADGPGNRDGFYVAKAGADAATPYTVETEDGDPLADFKSIEDALSHGAGMADQVGG